MRESIPKQTIYSFYSLIETGAAFSCDMNLKFMSIILKKPYAFTENADNLISESTGFFSYLYITSDVILPGFPPIIPKTLAFLLKFKAPRILSYSSQCCGNVIGQFPLYVQSFISMFDFKRSTTLLIRAHPVIQVCICRNDCSSPQKGFLMNKSF